MKTFQPHEIAWDKENTGRLWDFYGASEAHRDKYFGERIGPHLVRVIRRMGVFKGASRIIDFACGTGAIIEALLKVVPDGVRVSGCDPSSASIQRANERNRIHVGFAGTFQIEDLPTDLHDGAADLVFLTEVIEHLDDEMLEKVLRECNRILIPGGRLVISTPNEENLDREKTMCPECGCTFHRWQHQRKWSEASLSDCLKQVGFPHIRIEKVTWGNELINFLFTCTGKKKSGLLAIAQKSGDKRTLLPPAHT